MTYSFKPVWMTDGRGIARMTSLNEARSAFAFADTPIVVPPAPPAPRPLPLVIPAPPPPPPQPAILAWALVDDSIELKDVGVPFGGCREKVARARTCRWLRAIFGVEGGWMFGLVTQAKREADGGGVEVVVGESRRRGFVRKSRRGAAGIRARFMICQRLVMKMDV